MPDSVEMPAPVEHDDARRVAQPARDRRRARALRGQAGSPRLARIRCGGVGCALSRHPTPASPATGGGTVAGSDASVRRRLGRGLGPGGRVGVVVELALAVASPTARLRARARDGSRRRAAPVRRCPSARPARRASSATRRARRRASSTGAARWPTIHSSCSRLERGGQAAHVAAVHRRERAAHRDRRLVVGARELELARAGRGCA